MAIGTGISFTLSDALQEADKLDNHFNKWVQQSIEINANMRKAFTSKSTGEVATGLRDLKGLIDGIAGKTISPKTNAEDVQKLGDALDRVAKAVDLLANENIELFDTKGLYDTEKSLAETSAELSTVLDKISKLKNLWKEVSSWDIDKSAEALRASSGYQLTPEQAIAAAKQAQEIKKQEIEDELRIEIEKKAIAQKELQWAKKTQDEKAQYIQKKLDEIFKAEEQQANKIRAEYKRLNQELRNTVTSRGAIEDAVGGKVEEASKSGRITSMEKEAYDALVNYESELRQQILQMEIEHLEHISELRISYAAKDAKNIADEIKKRQYSASEALAMASSARTGEDMERAKEAVKNALMTVDKDDLKTIYELNKAYIDLRGAIEKLTKVQQNEKTLQPTLRNEYARILAEIDKVADAKKRLEQTDKYKEDDAQAKDDYEKLKAREADLLKRKAEIRNGNEALLTEIETKHAAERAQKRIQEYEREQKELEELEKKYGKISISDAEKIKDESSNVENVRQAKEAIEKLKEARDKLDKSDSKYSETVDELNAKIAEHEEFIESVTNAEKHREQQAKKARETYQGAMDYSKQAKSLNEMKEAMRALEVARNKEEVGTKKYKELDRELSRITKRYKELTGSAAKANRSLWNIGDQLTRKLALVFSVSQIQGYIHKLMEVRGEFELQKRSLDAILQNKDLADDVWQKTIDLAIKSPFRVKELVGYTKQLAAYRIEGDKLYETNKMLADVSAGLGVEMNRLILAYGQVRSAEYLRGTELRQFTEAGIPMLDELSKLLSETEGRAISAGEVFEMISKRMVGFAEVEEVFRRMTSAGGVFYQMQEKQADTLKGQISNLRDSIDLMLNAIGGEMEGVLKGGAEAVRKLVENWKDLVDVLNTFPVKAILAIFAQTKVASSGIGQAFYNFAGKIPLVSDGLLWLEISVESLTKKSKLLGKAWGGLLKIIGGTATIGATIGLVWLVKKLGEMYLRTTELERATKRLNKAWEDIFSEDTSELEKGIDSYTDLVTRLREANEGSQERRDIIRRLNSEYGQYLDFVVSETTSVEQLADSYDLVVKRMKEKASLATYEKGVQAIEDEYTTSLKYAKEEFYDIFKGMSIKREDSSFGGIIPTTEDVDNIYALVQQKIQELSAEQMDSLAEQQDIIQSIVKGYYGDEFFLSRDYANAIELMNVLAQKKEKEEELQKEINARYKETLKSREAHLAYQKLENEYAEEQRKINKEGSSIEDEALRAFEVGKKLEALRQQFELNKIQLQFDFGLISEEEMTKQKDKIINWATATTKSVNEAINAELGDDFSEMELSKVLINQERQSKGIAAILKDIQDSWEQQNATIAEQISLKSEGRVIDEDLLAKAIRMEELYRRVADILGVELKYTERLSEESRNAINALLPEDYQISLEEAYGGIDAILTNLKAKETEHLNVIEQLNEQKKNGLPIDEEKLRLAEENYKWAKKTQDLLDPKAKTPINEQRVSEINAKLEEGYRLDAIDQMKDEVTLLQEANTERQKAVAWQAQMVAMQAKGATFTQEEIDAAAKAVEQTLLRWQLLGGTEEEKKQRKSSDQLLDERIKVVDDMNKAYKDLNKTISKTEALEGAFAKYKDAFQKAYAGTSLLPKGFGNMTAQQFIKEFNFTTEEGMVGFFDKLIAYAKKTSEQVDVELAKGEYIMEARVELKKDEDKKLLDEVQGLFDQYELSLELKNLDIPESLAKQFTNAEYLSLEGLKKAVQEQEAKFIGTDMEDEYKKFLEKIDDMEDKASIERMKTYSKYLLEGMNERVRLKMEELKKLKEIEEVAQYSPAQKARIKAQVSKEAKAEQQKLEWQDFQGSEMYTMMFDDIEFMGTKALEVLKKKLEELKGSLKDLPASEVKEIINQISRIEDITIERNPFASMRDAMREVKELQAKGRTEESLQQTFAEAEIKRKSYQDELDAINLVLNAKDKEGLLNETSVEWQEKYGLYLSMSTEELEKQALAYDALATGQEMVSTNAKNDLDAYADARKSLKAVANQWNTFKQLADSAWGSAKTIMESLGVESDSLAVTIGDTAMNMVDLVFQAIMFDLQLKALTMQATALGIQMNAALGPIGWIVLALQAVATLLSAIFGAKDKALQKQVEKHKDEVENLQKAYEKLENSIDDAWDVASIRQYNAELKATTQSMIEAQKAAIAAQEKRKGANKEGSDVYNELQDMKEELDELQIQLDESLANSFSKVTDGILDSVHDAAREFTDAWWDAFVETGDGLKGLEENFNEIFLNLAKNQAAMQITGAFAERWKKDLEKYINVDDTELTKDEAREWAQKVRDTFPELSAALEGYLGAFKDMATETEDAGLSALQKGIQGVTEETAQVIEALLNSMRFYVADSNSELKNQTRILGNIYSLLDGMTDIMPTGKSGRGIKVVM